VPVTCVGPVIRGETLRSGRIYEMLRAVEPVLRAERAVVTKWAFTPGLDVDINQLARRGFQLASIENFAIPGTKSIDDYLKRLAPKQRAAIRRGGAGGLVTGPSTREEIIECFPGLVSGEQSRQGRVSEYSLTAARRLAERLADDPRLLWRSVRGAD